MAISHNYFRWHERRNVVDKSTMPTLCAEDDNLVPGRPATMEEFCLVDTVCTQVGLIAHFRPKRTVGGWTASTCRTITALFVGEAPLMLILEQRKCKHHLFAQFPEVAHSPVCSLGCTHRCQQRRLYPLGMLETQIVFRVNVIVVNTLDWPLCPSTRVDIELCHTEQHT